MLSRYVIAYIALWIFYPKFHKPASLRQEILILGAALCGSTLYFLAENYAVSYTQASNVSLLLAAVPILTSITAHLAGDEKLTRNIVLGFLVAMAGICLVVFNGNFILKLNPLGDLLALGAAFSWVFYTLIIRNIHQEHSYLYMTRKIFFYSILTMLPCIAIDGKLVSFQVLRQPVVYLNLLFLGLIASSLCYVTWYIVVDKLGAVKANNFIYFNPLVTMIAHRIF